MTSNSDRLTRQGLLLLAGQRVVVPVLDLKRLAEAEAMLARFSRENEWLALQVRSSPAQDACSVCKSSKDGCRRIRRMLC